MRSEFVVIASAGRKNLAQMGFAEDDDVIEAFAFGALCLLSIGLFDPPFWLLPIVICGAGIGGGCQAGINSLSGLVYPSAIRSTGAGWALGAWGKVIRAANIKVE
jgi:hypothetical protein